MTKQQDQIWDTLVSLDGETVLMAFTSYHGLQILDEGFAEFLVGEGYMEPFNEEDEDEESGGPEDGDYIITDSGSLGSMTVVSVLNDRWKDGDHCKEFSAEGEAVKAIKGDMTAQGHFPNVWHQDDHGGFALYNVYR
jgi:hypothetical protein